jgi:hypothetical protein
LVKVFIGTDVSSLHYVFGFVLVVQDRARDAMQSLVVPAHHDLI